ncbi:MAG: YhdP family protein [Methylotenera sp.]|nr:YhdP family protein [Methylotenera sp.]
MIKKSLLLVYRTVFWLVGIIVVLVLLTVLTIQFYVFPNIDQYKDKIATFASNAAKQKIVIGKIEAGWQGVHPHLLLSNIDVYDAQNRPALQLNNTDVSFSWLSIPLFEPHLANLTIRSPELTIRRNVNGDIFVAGVSMQGQSKPDLPNWLLRQNKFEVLGAKIIWLDEMRGAPALSLDHLNLQVVSPPWTSLLKNHRITLSALPSAGTKNPIIINANVYGNDVSHITEWRGSVQAQLKNTDIAAFKPWVNYSAFTRPIDLQSGTGSADVKIQFARHEVQSITSSVALHKVQMRLKAKAEPVLLNKLSGELNWEKSNAEQVFKVDRLSLETSNGLILQNASGSYANTLQGSQAIYLKLAHIDLALLQPYLVQLPIPADTLQKVAGHSPTGKLDDLTLNWAGKQSAVKTYQLNTKFNGLSILAHEKIPGFNNLTGEIKANQNNGKMILHTKNASLDFKDILRWPVPADKLDGDITWAIKNPQSKNPQTKIQTNNLTVSSAHLSGSLDASYLMDGNKGGYLDLKGKFGKGNAKFAPFYYPTMLGTTTLNWLDSSILAGRAENINLTVKGRLADFPFVDSKNNLDSKLGIFRVTAKVSDSLLEFGTGWPKIEGLGLDLLFEGKRMELNANAGHIFGNQIIKSKVTIAKLDADSPMLNVDSELKGPVDEGIKFVNASPVSTVTLGFTDDLKTNGSGKLVLNLKIPLQNIEAAQYKGAYQITNGSMAAAGIPTLTRINGLLEFTESSLFAKSINASAFGSPLALSLNTNKDKVIQVTARGKMSSAGFKQLLIEQSPDNASLANSVNYLAGSADWVGNITIQKPMVNVDIRSDLVGLSSTLPIPFNKAANERLNLRIAKKQVPNSDSITVNLGNKLTAKILRTGENDNLKFDSGSVRINSGGNSGEAATTNIGELNANVELGNTKGLQVYGSLDYLDADAWRSVLRDLTGGAKQETSLQSIPIKKLALKINTLDIFDRRINQLKISNNSNKDGLRAIVQSREITGDLQWLSQNNGKLVARLSNLTVPEATPNRTKTAPAETDAKVFNKLEQDYPSLDITADSFTFNKKNFGALALIAYPQNDNWNIQKLKLSTPDSAIDAEGQWNNWARNPNTYLNVTWDIKNLGKTLKSVGYPDTIKGGEGSLKGQLHWPGSPHEFNPVGLSGNLELHMKNGQILQVQPGVGRLLGLLSLQSLPRRLTLDFRDLFSNGFAFDKINASVKIDKGVMQSDNFTMSGPAADVIIKGETNLQKETQHLKIKVMPHVSDSLSLAALAGGPLVGAIAFLAQKILKDPLNKIASSDYEIIGTWDDPQEVKTASNKSSNESPLNQ